jgi:threonine dehydratase
VLPRERGGRYVHSANEPKHIAGQKVAAILSGGNLDLAQLPSILQHLHPAP